MTAHVEHGTIHSAGFSLFGRLSAAMETFVQAWRTEPIDVRSRETDEPPNLIPIVNPYALVVAALLAPRRIERDEL